MNKKKKKGLRLALLIVVIIITAFTVTMVACGLFKEKNAEKQSKEKSEALGEDATSFQQNAGIGDNSLNEMTDNEPSLQFDLSSLPDTAEPCGICIDDGSIYITDSYSKCVWKISDEGTEVFAGADSSRDIYDKPQGGYNDADSKEALFKMPWSVAPFLGGIAVSDTENNAIRLINGSKVDTINSSSGDTEYNYPTGITSNGEGVLFVADTHSDSIKTVTEDGKVSTFADGLDSPMGLSYSDGYLYIAETGKNRIIRISTLNLDSKKGSGDIELVGGSGEEGFKDGKSEDATFSSPKGVAVANDGTVYVADTVNGAVRKIKDGQVSTLEIKDSRMPDAELISPIGICIQGRKLYICDNFGKKIFIEEY